MAGGAMQGMVISNRYELDGRLGSGGMSSVYKATDQVLERTVAVKLLAEHLSDDEKFVARFRREALAVAKLIHPNIVQVYDTGVDEDRHYIVMEYVEGRSGAQILQTKGKVGPAAAAEIGVQACSGLEYAHRQGIIHRDVKPGNLMILGGPAADGGHPDGMTVKLTDFGIARAAEQTRLTQVGSVVGTAAYLAPEQARGEEATPAADVYALGVVLYQLLTGRLPHEGSTLAELTIRRDSEPVLPPHTYDPSIPETLSTAVLQALENDPAQRYDSARLLASALRMGMAGEDPTALVRGETTTRPLASGPMTERTRQLPPTEARRAPAPAPPRRPPPAPPPARERPARGRSFASSLARFLGMLLLIGIIAGVIVAVVLLLTEAGRETSAGLDLRETLDEQINSLEDFIRDNIAG